jgi:ubiquitin-like protein Pup
MAQRAQIKENKSHRAEDRVDEVQDAPAGKSGGPATELKHDLDDILDEIDELLEENAEEFVKEYVQKGGE